MTEENRGYRILSEDVDILVVWKRAGLALESARVTEADLVSRLRARYGEIYMVHRLDQPVEGIVIFARTKQAAAELSRQFRDGRAEKKYRALVTGPIPSGEGRLEDWLLKDGRQNMSVVVPAPPGKDIPGKGEAARGKTARGKTASGKSASAGRTARGRAVPRKAVLEYRQTGPSELEITLLTGRHHQIRAQLAHAGMPIYGDRKYGGAADKTGILPRGAIALCAASLTVFHPRTRARMTFRAEPSFADGSRA